MPTFEYKALQADGTIAEGEVEAGGRQEAFRQMEGRGLRPIRLAERGSGNGAARTPAKAAVKEPSAEKTNAARPSLKLSLGSPNKVSARMLENFTRLLSSLLAAGVPLSRALVIMCKEASAPVAAAKWKQVHDLVIDGMSLADAMAKSPETFPRVYVAMVEAGEAGGFLDVVLGQIADFQAREKEIRSNVMSALLYPTILLGLSSCVLVFLLIYFIPNFVPVFKSFGGQLPLLTQMIISTSDLLRSYGLFVLLGGGVAGLLVRNWLVSTEGRRKWEGWVLRAPVVGLVLAHVAMARLCR